MSNKPMEIPLKIWRKRGIILEDYVFKDWSVYQLATYHKVKMPIVQYFVDQYENHSQPVIMQIEAWDEDEPNVDKDTFEQYITKHKMIYLNRMIFVHGGIAQACAHMKCSRSVFYNVSNDFKKTRKKETLKEK